MALVAIVDDRLDVRERLAKRVKRELKKQQVHWPVEHFPPLEKKEDYPKWIVNNKVVILIVDERLKEKPIKGNQHATYNGHDLVEEVRRYNKQIPIYIITAHSTDSDLESMKGEMEDIITRDKFAKTDSSEQYVKRFIRATQTYLRNFEAEYLRLAELSELVALDKASEEDLNELKALQAKMNLPLSSFISKDRSQWLSELEEKSDKLDKLRLQLEEMINEQ